MSTLHFYWIGAVPAMVFLGIVMMPFYYGSRVRSVPEFLLRRFRYAILRRSLARLGAFTSNEIERYVDAWSKPGALTGMTNYYRAMRKRKGMRGLMRRIDVPTLMIWGDLDPFFTRETLRDFAEYVPNLRIEHIPDSGHFVQTDAPGRVNELMLGFARETAVLP